MTPSTLTPRRGNRRSRPSRPGHCQTEARCNRTAAASALHAADVADAADARHPLAAACRRALVAWVVIAPLSAAAAVETVWLGPTGNWMEPMNWSLGVPGPTDTAVLGASAGTATLDIDQVIFGLMQNGGTLAGGGMLTVLGPASWSAGIHSGPGTTRFTGALLIDGAATRTISGPRSVVVGGAAAWTGNTAPGNGTISMSTSGGTSSLRITGEMVESQAFDHAVIGTGRVEIDGRWHKVGGATTTISPSFHNHGEVRLDAGRMRVGGGGTHSGVFRLDADAVLEFSGGTHVLDALSSTTGSGSVHVSGGTVAFDGGSHTADLLLSGGMLGGAEHLHQGAATWTGGAIVGAGTTTLAGTLAIEGAASRTISGPRTVVIDGTASWTGNTADGNGTIFMTTSGGVSTLRIAGAMVEAQGFDHAISSTSSSARVEVEGLWHKQGAAVTNISASLHNHGGVHLDAGRLRASGGGTHSGAFQIATDAVLEFAGGTHTLAPTGAIDGNGTWQISGGTADLQSIQHSARLLLSGGTLAGGDHVLHGHATFSGGWVSGAATTTFAGGSTLTGSTSKQLTAGRTLVLQGESSWEGNTAANNGTFFLGSTGGATTLRVDGTMTEQQAFDHMLSGNGRLTVAGHWLKTSDTLSHFTSGVELDNPGTVEVAAGTLRVARSFTNAGTIEVQTDATFASTCFAGGGVCFRNEGLIKGSGTIVPPATGLANGGVIAPGHSIGMLTIDGPLLLGAEGEVRIELADLGAFDQLQVTGAAALGGSLALWNSGYAPVLGESFAVMAFGSSSGSFDGFSWHGFGSEVAFELTQGVAGVTVTVTAVPEPSTWVSLLAGVALLAGWRLRRQRPGQDTRV
jgi:hypothetical protein